MNPLPEYLFPVHPRWCELITEGKKTVEVRKRVPKQVPFVGYIYCTKPKYPHEDFLAVNAGTPDAFCYYAGGKVIGEFLCKEVFDLWPGYTGNRGDTCMTFDQEEQYLGTNGHGYGIVMSDVKIYREPIGLENFRKPCIMNEMPYCPSCPKGYVYISEDEAAFPNDAGGQMTEWHCLNHLNKAPQMWCRVKRHI